MYASYYVPKKYFHANFLAYSTPGLVLFPNHYIGTKILDFTAQEDVFSVIK